MNVKDFRRPNNRPNNRQNMHEPSRSFNILFKLVMGFVIGIFCLIMGSFVYMLFSASGSSYSVGIGGIAEQRCIGGYEHVIVNGVSSRQIFDDQGRGIKCQQ